MDKNFCIQFPKNQTLSLNHEYCYATIQNKTCKIRFHNYKKVYSIPGFYEDLFHQKLRCNSPMIVCNFLKKEVKKFENIKDLIVLDLGAGNGLVGEQLHRIGVKTIYGVDIIEEAVKATERDRPNIYKDYYIKDLAKISSLFYKKIKAKKINCMTTISTLGFNDIPIKTFATGFNLLTIPAWVAFNIKENFLDKNDITGFSLLIHKMLDNKIFDICLQKKYRHRLSIEGKPIYYIAIVGKKKSNISNSVILNIEKEIKLH